MFTQHFASFTYLNRYSLFVIWIEISFMKTACYLMLLIFSYVHQKNCFWTSLFVCLFVVLSLCYFRHQNLCLKLKFTYRVENDQSTQIMQKENSNIYFRMQRNETQAQQRWDLKTQKRTRLTMKMIMTLKMTVLTVAPMNNLHAKIKSAFQLFSDVMVSITA